MDAHALICAVEDALADAKSGNALVRMHGESKLVDLVPQLLASYRRVLNGVRGEEMISFSPSQEWSEELYQTISNATKDGDDSTKTMEEYEDQLR